MNYCMYCLKISYGPVCTGHLYKTPAQMESPEYKTLVQWYPTLVSCVQQSPDDITLHLRSSGLLAQHDIEYLRHPYISDGDKARRLLDIVLNQVKIDPQVYHSFIAALEASGPWTREVVSRLERTYDSVMQSPTADVYSTEEPGESLVVVFLIFVHLLVQF